MLCLITDDSYIDLLLVCSYWTNKAKLVNSVLSRVEFYDVT